MCIDKFKREVVFWLLPFCLMILFFYDFVLTTDIFADRDVLMVYIPMANYWRERLLAGSFPDWYPYDGLGQPFVGNLFGLAFHPLQWLSLALPAATGIKWGILLCFPLSFMGFYLFIRFFKISMAAAAMGALVYAFNGYSVSMSNNYPYLLALTQLPWAYWLTLRALDKTTPARIFLAALAFALILFGGETQTFILGCATGVFSIFIFRDRSKWLRAFGVYVVIMLVTALISAVQWVPSLHLMSQASPGATHSIDKALVWSLHPLRMLEFLFGGLTGNSSDSVSLFSQTIYNHHFSGFWARSVLITTPVFVFCLVGLFQKKRFSAFLGLMFVFCLLLALGKYVGLYESMRVIPLFRPFRYPEKLVSFLMLIVSILAAFGYSRLERMDTFSKSKCVFLMVGLLLSAGFLIFESFDGWSKLILNKITNLKNPIPETISAEIHDQSMLFQAISLVGIAFIFYLMRKNRNLAAVCSFGVITLLLWMGSRGIYSPAIKDISERAVPPVDVMQQYSSSEPPRFATMSVKLNSSITRDHPELTEEIQRMVNVFLLAGPYPSIFHLEPMSFYMPGASRRYRTIMEKTSRKHVFETLGPMYSGEFFTIFGADYAAFEGTTDRVLYEHPFLGALVVRNEGVMPRAYLSQPICVTSKEASLDMVLKGSFDYHRYTVVECPDENYLPRMTPDDVALGAVEILSREPEHVVIEVEALQNALLVLTDAYYTGWTATIDGEAVDILPANHAVRGVPVTPGKHIVEFKYRTPGLVPAAIVSVVTLILGVILSVLFWRRARRNADDLSVNKNITDEEESMQAA